jgi:hypothetical protein
MYILFSIYLYRYLGANHGACHTAVALRLSMRFRRIVPHFIDIPGRFQHFFPAKYYAEIAPLAEFTPYYNLAFGFHHTAFLYLTILFHALYTLNQKIY